MREQSAVIKADLWNIARQAVSDLVADVQEPGPSVGSAKKLIAAGEGVSSRYRRSKRAYGPVSRAAFGPGRLPVDTGYLRASLVASKTGWPAPTERPEGQERFVYSSGPIDLAIAGWQPGEPLFIAYTASYAPFVEARYMFVSLAGQRWPQYVDAATARFGDALRGRQ